MQKFGLNELEQLQAQMKVGKREAKIIKLIGAVTGLPIVVVSEVRDVIAAVNTKVGGLTQGVVSVKKNDEKDEADSQETINHLRVARNDRKEENRQEQERMTNERKDAEANARRMEKILKNFA